MLFKKKTPHNWKLKIKLFYYLSNNLLFIKSIYFSLQCIQTSIKIIKIYLKVSEKDTNEQCCMPVNNCAIPRKINMIFFFFSFWAPTYWSQFVPWLGVFSEAGIPEWIAELWYKCHHNYQSGCLQTQSTCVLSFWVLAGRRAMTGS